MDDKEEILVIKHGALGDIILATGPFASIRAQHPNAHITLLTARPYDKLLSDAPFFDEIWLDDKPKPWHFGPVARLRKLLKSKQFDWVYDLQTSERSTRYFQWLNHPNLSYSGLAKGSHQHNTPERTKLHTVDRQRQQLEIAGIGNVLSPDIRWMTESIAELNLPAQYALLIPGGSAHRPEKRWPEQQFADCATHLQQRGITPVWVGAGAEEGLINRLAAKTEGSINLCNKTSFTQLAELARGALFAIGNDTGPMHIIAATECKSLVLFSHASNPELCAPRGGHVGILRKPSLSDVTVDEVFAELSLEALQQSA